MISNAAQDEIPKSGWTLAAIKQAGLVLEGHCQNESCRRFYAFNLDGLIACAGPDYLPPETLPGITCAICGGALRARLAMLPPDDRADGMAHSPDLAERIRLFEVQADSAISAMYDATDPTTAAAHYSNAKEALHTAIGLATTSEDDALPQRLRARLAHIKAVFRSQFL